MSKTTHKTSRLQANTCEYPVNTRAISRHPSSWRGRRGGGNGFTVVPNTVIDRRGSLNSTAQNALFTLLSHSHNETGTIQIGRSRLGEMLGKSSSTAKRALDALVEHGHLVLVSRSFDKGRGCWDENVYLVVANPSKNDRTPTVKNDTSVLINNSSENLKSVTPLPPKGGGEVTHVQEPEPQRPVPSADVHAALEQAREFRRRRKAERRERRHSEAREGRRRRCEEPTPVQKAVRHVMVVLKVSPGLWATRRAIETSVERWMKERDCCAEGAASGLIARWKDYLVWSRMVEYPCGMMTWFGECRWLEERMPKSVWRNVRSAMDNVVGAAPVPARVVDTEALKAKMAALLAGVDLREEE